MGATDPYYLFVSSEGFPPTVFDSQVLGRLASMAAEGVLFDLFVFERAVGAVQNLPKNLERYQQVRSSTPGRLTYGVYLTSFLEADLALPINELRIALRARGLGDETPIVVHARTATAMRIAAGLRPYFRRLKLVFDLRGDSAAEYRAREARQTGPLARRWAKFKADRLEAIHKASIVGADNVFCVSEPLRQKVIAEHGYDPAKIFVVPTSADAELFRYDQALRDKTRNELGIQHKTVLIYSGSLAGYQWIDRVLALTRLAWERDPNVHLLLVTPAIEEMTQRASEKLPSSAFSVRSSPHNQVVKWLNAADAGWLIREQSPVNFVAAPTKFAEQTMCGLPVIMTPNIGDYSQLAQRERLGVVLGPDASGSDLDQAWHAIVSLAKRSERHRIASAAAARLSHQTYATVAAARYRALAGQSGS